MIKVLNGKPITNCNECNKLYFLQQLKAPSFSYACVTKKMFFIVKGTLQTIPKECPLKDYTVNRDVGLLEVVKEIIKNRGVSREDIAIMEELINAPKPKPKERR